MNFVIDNIEKLVVKIGEEKVTLTDLINIIINFVNDLIKNEF